MKPPQPRDLPSMPAGQEFPKPLLPWQPSERSRLLDEPGVGAHWLVRQLATGPERDKAREYAYWLDWHCLFPGDVVSKVLTPSISEKSPILHLVATRQTQEDYKGMWRRFEQEHLGLEPSSSVDGIRYWESSAGFSGATYPTELVSGLIDMSAEDFMSYLEENSFPGGKIVIKAKDFLIPVAPSHSPDFVEISGVIELTQDGHEVLEQLLSAYEHGLNQAAAV